MKLLGFLLIFVAGFYGAELDFRAGLDPGWRYPVSAFWLIVILSVGYCFLLGAKK